MVESRRGSINFEGEVEQAQTNALAGRMLEQAGLGHLFAGKTIYKFTTYNLGTNNAMAEIEFTDGNKVKFEGMFRIDSTLTEFMQALREENARQTGPIVPDPARIEGDRLIAEAEERRREREEAEETAPEEPTTFDNPTAYPIDPPTIDGPEITKET